MLCDACKKSNATVFIADESTTEPAKRCLCDACAHSFFELPANEPFVPLHIAPFDDIATSLAAAGNSFTADAYHFVREALNHAKLIHHSSQNDADTFSQHISAYELLDAFASLARERFGRHALPKLSSWGIRSCDHVGAIVYDLIEAGALCADERDSREDFSPGYDFHVVFPETEPNV